jgi:hypothetical protein
MIACAGCGEEVVKEPSGSLTGQVFSGSQAIGKCRVKLYNQLTYKSLMTNVEEDGTYEFEEVPTGDCVLAVTTEPWYEASEPPPDPRIPKKYRDVKSSGLSITIEEGENNLDLKMIK